MIWAGNFGATLILACDQLEKFNMKNDSDCKLLHCLRHQNHRSSVLFNQFGGLIYLREANKF